MEVISTNIGKPTIIKWNNKDVTTGIFKNPVEEGIYLGKEIVKGDEVSDRKVHGGEFKACYLFSEDYYSYWKNLYPQLNWTYGMLGENLTVKGLDESKIYIGDIYKLGTSLVQVTQPREPCYKFGVKFGSQKVLKQFIDHKHPGTYVRVLEEGLVKVGNELKLIKRPKNSLTTLQFFDLLYAKNKDQVLLSLVVNNEALPLKKRKKFEAFISN